MASELEGIFAKVQTATQNPDGVEERKNVLFYADEASKYSFNFGLGAEVARFGGDRTSLSSPGANRRASWDQRLFHSRAFTTFPQGRPATAGHPRDPLLELALEYRRSPLNIRPC